MMGNPSDEVDIYSDLSPPPAAVDNNKAKRLTNGTDGASDSNFKMPPPPSPQDDSSNMSTFDLYSDLIDEENAPKETVQQLHEENDAHQGKIQGLLSKIESLQNENVSVQHQNTQLKKNISALLKTAKLEMKRKDWELTQLRLRTNNESEREKRKYPEYPEPVDTERPTRNQGFNSDRVNPNLMPLGKQRNMGARPRDDHHGGSSRQLSPVRTSRRDHDRSRSPARKRPDRPHTPPKHDIKDRSKSPVKHRPQGPHTPPPLKDDVRDRSKSLRHRPRGPHTPPPKDAHVSDRSKSPGSCRTSGPHTPPQQEDFVKDRSKSPVRQRLCGPITPPKSPNRSHSPKPEKSKSRDRSRSPGSYSATSAKTYSKERLQSPSKCTQLRSRERSKSPVLRSDKSSISKSRSHSPSVSSLPKKIDRRRESHEKSHHEKSSRDTRRSHSSRYSDHEKHHDRKYERRDSRTDSRAERKRKRSDDEDGKVSSSTKYSSRELRDIEKRKRDDRRYEREMSRLSDSIRKRKVDKARRSVDRACDTLNRSPTKHKDRPSVDNEERLRKRHNSEMARKKSVQKAKEALYKPKYTPPKAGGDDNDSSKSRRMLRSKSITRSLVRKMTPVRTLDKCKVDQELSDQSRSSRVRSADKDTVTKGKSNVEGEQSRYSDDIRTDRQEPKADLEDGEVASDDEAISCDTANQKVQRTNKEVVHCPKITYEEPSSKEVGTVQSDNNQVVASADGSKLTEAPIKDKEITSERLQEDVPAKMDNPEVETALPAAETTHALTHYDSGEEILDYNESDLESESDPVEQIQNHSVPDEMSLSAPMEIMIDSSDLAQSSQEVITNSTCIAVNGSSATTNLEKEAVLAGSPEKETNSDGPNNKEHESISESCINEGTLAGEISEPNASEQHLNVQLEDNSKCRQSSSPAVPDISDKKATHDVATRGSPIEQKSISDIPDLASNTLDLASNIPDLASNIPDLASNIPDLASNIPDLHSQPEVNKQTTGSDLCEEKLETPKNVMTVSPSKLEIKANVTTESPTVASGISEQRTINTPEPHALNDIKDVVVCPPKGEVPEPDTLVSESTGVLISNKIEAMVQKSHPPEHILHKQQSLIEPSSLMNPDNHPVQLLSSQAGCEVVIMTEVLINKEVTVKLTDIGALGNNLTTSEKEPVTSPVVIHGRTNKSMEIEEVVMVDDDSSGNNVLTSKSGCTLEYIDYCIDSAEKLRNRSQDNSSKDREQVESELDGSAKRKRRSSVEQDTQNEIHDRKSMQDTSNLITDKPSSDIVVHCEDAVTEDVTVKNVAKDIQEQVTAILPVAKDLEPTRVLKDGADPLPNASTVMGVKVDITSKPGNSTHKTGSVLNEDARLTQLKVDDKEGRTISPPLTYEFSSLFMETIDTPMMKRRCSSTSGGSQGDSDQQSESFNSSGTSSNGTGDMAHISDGIDDLIQHAGHTVHDWDGKPGLQEEIERLEATAGRALDIIFASRFTQRIQKFKENKSRTKRRKMSDSQQHDNIIAEPSCSKDDQIPSPVMLDATSRDGESHGQQLTKEPVIIEDRSLDAYPHDQQKSVQDPVTTDGTSNSAIIVGDKSSSLQVQESEPNTIESEIRSNTNGSMHGVEHAESVDLIISTATSQELASIDDSSNNPGGQCYESAPEKESVHEQPKGNVSLSPDIVLFKEPSTREGTDISSEAVVFKEPPGREEEVTSCTPPQFQNAERVGGNVDDFMELHPHDSSLIDDVFHEEVLSSTTDNDISKSGNSHMTSTPKEKSSGTKSETKSSEVMSCEKADISSSKVTQSRKSSVSKSTPESKTNRNQTASFRSERSRSNASSTSHDCKDERYRLKKHQQSDNSRTDKERRTKSVSSSDSYGKPARRKSSQNSSLPGHHFPRDRTKDRFPSESKKDRSSRHEPPRYDKREERVRPGRDNKSSHERTIAPNKEDIQAILRGVSHRIATNIDTIQARKANSRERNQPKPFQKVERNKLGPFGLNLSGDGDVPTETKSNSVLGRSDEKVSRKRPLDESLSEGEIVSDDESDTEGTVSQADTRIGASERYISKKKSVTNTNRARNVPVRQSPRHKLMEERDRRRKELKKRDGSQPSRQSASRR